VTLNSLHLLKNLIRLKHRNSSLLERYIGTTIQVRTTRPNSLNEFLRPNNPSDSPARKSEALGKTIDDQNIILINILNVFSGGDGSSVTVTGVVVSSIELVHDERSSVTA
jgi:hypothetical protein